MTETIESLGLLPHYDLFINGEFVKSTNPEAKCTAKSPVDGSTLSTFADATKEDLDKAVDAAQGFDGSALGLNGSDEVSGSTTCVPVGLKCLEDGRLSVRFNSRTCISADQEALRKHLSELCAEHGFTLQCPVGNGGCLRKEMPK